MITDVRDFLCQLANIDQRAAMWCACKCARTVLHLAPEGEGRPRLAIEVAEAWIRGNATKRRLRRVATRVAPATRPHRWREGGVYETAHAVARAASHAAGDGGEFTSFSAGAVVDAVRHAARLAGIEPPEHLPTLVSSERWPLTVPALDQLRAAPEGVQVAWDLVASDDRTEHTIPELVEAHARAERLGLDWNDPVQRAGAERTTDENRVRQMLASRRAP